MVDEDFVLGYVTGYNDGVGSGGGGSGGDVPAGDTIIYKDVTIAKQWNLSGTPFSIALFDVHSERLICGAWGTHILENLYGTEYNWDRLTVTYWLSMGLLYNGDIVTVNPLFAVGDALILNGAPGIQESETKILSVGGRVVVDHSVSGSVHLFSVIVCPSYTYNEKNYRLGEVISEADKTRELGSVSAMSWQLSVSDSGGKSISSYNPYWFFYPSATGASSASYIEKGTMGVPKGTSLQQLLQTGLLFDTLKESLLNAGENVTLEEV